MATDAGVDSGIVDPVSLSVDRALRADRTALPFVLAVDVLTGVDAFAMEYLAAVRAGALG